MQTELDFAPESPDQSSSGKMFPESSTPQTTHSDAYSPSYPGRTVLLSKNGQKLAESWDVDGEWRGASSTANTSVFHSAVGGSLPLPSLPSLSMILQSQTPEKYFLSERACEGILRRAHNKEKILPPLLDQALRTVIGKEVKFTQPSTEEALEVPEAQTKNYSLKGELDLFPNSTGK